MVNFVTTEQQFKETLSQNELVIVDFTASWCGPCKQMAPVYDKLSQEYPQAVFIKVDVDQVSSVAAQEAITAMPTFVTYIQGKRYQEMKGADRNGLNRLVEQSCDHFEFTVKRQRDALEQKKAELKRLQETPLEETEEDLMKKPVKELKVMIQERGWSLVGLAEKGDLVRKLKTGQ